MVSPGGRIDWHAPCHIEVPTAHPGASQREETNVDTDRIEGPLKEAGGKVKEEWGDATDDASTEAEGQMDQAEGKVQNEWGETKDTARDVLDDDR
jgi:uncharacterized protein YjbJ (UPF0337 family)